MLVVLPVASPSVRALAPGLAATQYTHELWTTEQGLPQNSVFDVLQTRDGYLWMATQEGLVRFDGVRFTVFNKQNTEAIQHNDVWTLLEDRDGTLWVGTRGGGLVSYRDGRFRTWSQADGLSNDSVQALWQDRDGSLWIGTRGGGVNRFADGKFHTYTVDDGLPNNTVYAIFGDRDGKLWMGTDGGGVARFADGKFETFSKEQGILHGTVYAIAQDFDGDLWVGTGKGLFRRKGQRWLAYHASDGLANENVRVIQQDRQGNIWIGTDGGGLFRFRGGRFEAFDSGDGLSNDNVGAIFEDREGSLWIGTDAGGLNRLRDNTFITWSVDEGLPNDNVRAVLEDRDGAMWFGTFGGLARLSGGKFTHFTTAQGLSADIVLSLMQDRDGALWVGTLGGGLNRFKNGRFTKFGTADGLSNNSVMCLLQADDGAIWAGTRSGGLNRLKDGRFEVFTTAQGLGSDDIRVLAKARDGGFWIGMLGGGLARYVDGSINSYRRAQGLTHDHVLSLHEDADGVLWIGTFGGGLIRMKDGVFSTFTTKHGLGHDAIYQILEDDSQHLWMSSNRGVFRVSKRDFDEVLAGSRERVRSLAFGSADGMKSAEANGAHQPAGWRGADGRIWFPTVRGAVVVNPARLRANELVPPVRIEALRVGTHSVDLSGRATVPPGRQTLEFDYTALSFLAPQKVQFKVRLEGYDEEWVAAGTKRTATYTNLPPGDYRFHVKASNNDGVWNEIGASLDLEIQPLFYQRKAFYLVYVLLAAGLLYLALRFYRARVEGLRQRERDLLELIQQNAQAEDALRKANAALEDRNEALGRSNAELERFVYVASHDLKEPLRSVVSYTQLLAKKYRGKLDADADQYMDYAVKGARNVQGHIENLIQYSRAGKVESEVDKTSFDAAFDRALAHLQEAITESGAVITSDPLPELRAHPTEALQLFQNLLGNAMKFHGQDKPRIHVSAVEDPVHEEWLFTVADNGIGIEPQHRENVFKLFSRLHSQDEIPGTGIGLSLCKKVVEARGGRIWIEDNPGGGTLFKFTLPA